MPFRRLPFFVWAVSLFFQFAPQKKGKNRQINEISFFWIFFLVGGVLLCYNIIDRVQQMDLILFSFRVEENMLKRILSICLAVLLSVSVAVTLASCNKKPADSGNTAYGFEGTKELAKSGTVSTTDVAVTGDVSKVKIGVILVGDETEGYTLAHINGIKTAAASIGIADDQILWRYNVPETDKVVEAANQLIAAGCTLVISNSYGHQDYMLTAAKDNPNVQFVAMTGDTAAAAKAAGTANFSNAFTAVYESRYVSGVVAGLKLKELVDAGKVTDANKNSDGTIKIGYVGAYNYAEVFSGYTAFYLGLKSVVPNVSMEVYYTSSWFNFDAEKSAAEYLIGRGCVIIGQHADSAGAPTAVEAALQKGTVVYSVGYNVSMLDAAPHAALTSASNNWAAYYQYAFATVVNGGKIDTNWAAGYAHNAVNITELGASVAAGTAQKVAEVEAAIKAGTLHVFDTSTFTVGGKTVTWAYATDTDGDWSYDANNVIADGYYHESFVQSAPSLTLRIDGITELN